MPIQVKYFTLEFGRRSRPKITFGKQANIDLDELGLHGKERKKAKKYHKHLIKSHMQTIPLAHTASIARVAHVGGSTPGDPLHITVAYRKKPPLNPTKSQLKKAVIPKTYLNENGVERTGGLHHVYPTKECKLPHSYATAERIRAGLPPGAPIPHRD